MDYALALELKKAKFPFKVGLDNHGYGIHFGDTVLYRPPTLEELINACGDRFSSLWKYQNEWEAADSKTGISYTGSTYIEAVAKLWLGIHKTCAGCCACPHN